MLRVTSCLLESPKWIIISLVVVALLLHLGLVIRLRNPDY